MARKLNHSISESRSLVVVGRGRVLIISLVPVGIGSIGTLCVCVWGGVSPTRY